MKRTSYDWNQVGSIRPVATRNNFASSSIFLPNGLRMFAGDDVARLEQGKGRGPLLPVRGSLTECTLSRILVVRALLQYFAYHQQCSHEFTIKTTTHVLTDKHGD